MKGEKFLEHMIRFTHINVVTNSNDYIYSSINVEVSQDQHQFLLNPRVEDLNARIPALASVGKGARNKIAKMNLDSLVAIKAWSGLANS